MESKTQKKTWLFENLHFPTFDDIKTIELISWAFIGNPYTIDSKTVEEDPRFDENGNVKMQWLDQKTMDRMVLEYLIPTSENYMVDMWEVIYDEQIVRGNAVLEPLFQDYRQANINEYIGPPGPDQDLAIEQDFIIDDIEMGGPVAEVWWNWKSLEGKQETFPQIKDPIFEFEVIFLGLVTRDVIDLLSDDILRKWADSYGFTEEQKKIVNTSLYPNVLTGLIMDFVDSREVMTDFILHKQQILVGAMQKYLESYQPRDNQIEKYLEILMMITESYERFYPIKNTEPKLLGQGNFGKIYLNTNNTVTKQYTDGEKQFYSILREVAALKALQNESNIIQLVNINITSDIQEIVLPYYQYDLKQYYEENSLIDVQIKSIMWQILNGMYSCQNKNIYHRDLKPENILVSQNQNKQLDVVVTDFGNSRFSQVDEPHVKTTEKISGKWSEGIVSLYYRAPEILASQILEKPYIYNYSFEVWSIGCIFIELYMGYNIFDRQSSYYKYQFNNIFSVLGLNGSKQLLEDPEKALDIKQPHLKDSMMILKAREKNPDIPEQAINLISKMLRINPENRITIRDALQDVYFSDLKLQIPVQVSSLNKIQGMLVPISFDRKDFSEAEENRRKIVNNWLYSVFLYFNYNYPTLFLCFYLLDRVLTSKNILRDELQGVGCICLHLSAMIFEVSYAEPVKYVDIVDGAFNLEWFNDNTYKIANLLNYRLYVSTEWNYVIEYFVKYISPLNIELTLSDKIVKEWTELILQALLLIKSREYKTQELVVSCLKIVVDFNFIKIPEFNLENVNENIIEYVKETSKLKTAIKDNSKILKWLSES